MLPPENDGIKKTSLAYTTGAQHYFSIVITLITVTLSTERDTAMKPFHAMPFRANIPCSLVQRNQGRTIETC
jgi:hypothetical protein